jgi:hypothetical protein
MMMQHCVILLQYDSTVCSFAHHPLVNGLTHKGRDPCFRWFGLSHKPLGVHGVYCREYYVESLYIDI